MCIRDSASIAKLTQITALEIDSGPWGDSDRPGTLRALPTACLLYTSDAADERSSVDLGGRRIIKKKNNTT